MSVASLRAARVQKLLSAQFDRTITIQEATETQSDSGDAVQTWSDLDTVDAHVVVESGEEQTEGAGRQARRTATIRILWRDDITSKNRILYNDETYDIQLVAEMGYQAFLKITAVAKVL